MTSGHHVLAFESFGARIGIRADGLDPEALKIRLPPRGIQIPAEQCDTVYLVRSRTSQHGSSEVRYDLFLDGRGMGTSRDLAKVQAEIESDVHFRVALWARSYVFVHAGVVRWKGRAIVVPGRSMSGKSSLVLAMVQAGAEYFSDEFAVLGPRGEVHPYPKPLSERHGPSTPRMHSAESLGARQSAPPIPIGLTVVTSFQEGATWAPRSISPAAALMAMLANTVSVRSRPKSTLDILARAAAGTVALEGERGDAREAATAILRWV